MSIDARKIDEVLTSRRYRMGWFVAAMLVVLAVSGLSNVDSKTPPLAIVMGSGLFLFTLALALTLLFPQRLAFLRPWLLAAGTVAFVYLLALTFNALFLSHLPVLRGWRGYGVTAFLLYLHVFAFSLGMPARPRHRDFRRGLGVIFAVTFAFESALLLYRGASVTAVLANPVTFLPPVIVAAFYAGWAIADKTKPDADFSASGSS